MGFCRLCTDPSGYKLGRHRSRSTLYLKLNIQDFKAVFEELFNGSSSTFAASLVPELFTRLLENSQREQTIVIIS